MKTINKLLIISAVSSQYVLSRPDKAENEKITIEQGSFSYDVQTRVLENPNASAVWLDGFSLGTIVEKTTQSEPVKENPEENKMPNIKDELNALKSATDKETKAVIEYSKTLFKQTGLRNVSTDKSGLNESSGTNDENSSKSTTSFDLQGLKTCVKDMVPVIKKYLWVKNKKEDADTYAPMQDAIEELMGSTQVMIEGGYSSQLCGKYLGQYAVPQQNILEELKSLIAFRNAKDAEDLKVFIKIQMLSKHPRSPLVNDPLYGKLFIRARYRLGMYSVIEKNIEQQYISKAWINRNELLKGVFWPMPWSVVTRVDEVSLSLDKHVPNSILNTGDRYWETVVSAAGEIK